MTLDCYSSQPHYNDHLIPIWRALPDYLRGRFYVSSRHEAQLNAAGIEATVAPIPVNANPILVAGHSDYRMTRTREVVFVEHGAGQAYGVLNAAYSGGPDRERVRLFICPNQTVADRNLATYLNTRSVVVGSPRLDRYHPPIPKPISDPPVIAFAWHADLRLVPETASAFSEFHTAIGLVASHGYEVLGHGHPRILARLAPFYKKYGVRVVTDVEVFERADVLIVDSSSIGFEFASLNRPVVWMSPTFYRRDVTAWPRFWDALVLGEDACGPEDVPGAVWRALQPISPELTAARSTFISSVYSPTDGRAAIRAARAIEEVVSDERRPALHHRAGSA